jgi:hypothetical protein
MPGNTRRKPTREQKIREEQQSQWAKEIGQRIKDALQENKGGDGDLATTQRELSDRLGVTERLVGSWASGERIPWTHQSGLSEHLGRSRRWIMYGDDPPEGSKQDIIIEKLDEILSLLNGHALDGKTRLKR